MAEEYTQYIESTNMGLTKVVFLYFSQSSLIYIEYNYSPPNYTQYTVIHHRNKRNPYNNVYRAETNPLCLSILQTLRLWRQHYIFDIHLKFKTNW